MGENGKGEAKRFTVRDFVAEGRERLHLEIVVDAGLDAVVGEPMTYRPGLALTGFFENFAWKRLQVIGKAERAYLMSLEPAVRNDRIQALFAHGAYCIIFACGMEVPPGVAEIVRDAGGSVLRTDLLTRDFAHLSTFVMERLTAPTTKLYATTVEVAGMGVMMRGAPGLGKSETALGLIKHGNALVADDFTCLRKDVAGNVLYASASAATSEYMEIRGIGIIHVPSVFGVTAVRGEKQLDFVITFRRMEEVNGELDRVGEDVRMANFLGVDVPEIVIPVSAGRDLVNLVETAAQQQKLRAAGHDAAGNLDARLKARAMQ
ncbi:MAG: HPr(Ser) kinase/phosphatase [Kiritimatiellae bacterium]|nr:HPr(Ser) kinase/phosphatase [Kiritimatiellia bacterium]